MRLILRRYSTGVGVGGFLNTAGTNTGAVSSLQAFTSGIVTGIVRPASDSTTAFRVQNAAGSTDVLTFDTTNNKLAMTGQIGVGEAPYASHPLSINTPFSENIYGIATVQMGVYANNAPAAIGTGGAIGLGGKSGLAVNPYINALVLGGRESLATYAGYFAIYTTSGGGGETNSANYERLRVSSVGNVGVGTTSPAALLDIAASTSARAALRVRSGTVPTSPNDGDIARGSTGFTLYNIDSGTNAVINHVIANRQSSGTPEAGFGVGFAALLESSTTVDQNAGQLTFAWSTATHATRASKGQLSAYYTSTERPTITWGANSTVSLLSFHDVTTPIARPVLATGAGRTADDIITVLQNYGLVKQS